MRTSVEKQVARNSAVLVGGKHSLFPKVKNVNLFYPSSYIIEQKNL